MYENDANSRLANMSGTYMISYIPQISPYNLSKVMLSYLAIVLGRDVVHPTEVVMGLKEPAQLLWEVL